MAESDEKIEKLLRELPDNLDSVSFLSDKYSELAGYNMDGALSARVGEALKRIREFAETKLKNFDAEKVTPESAVAWQTYLSVAEKGRELSEEEQKRNDDIRAAIKTHLEQYDKEENIPDVDENTDIVANCEAWDKASEGIRPFEEVVREDGTKIYRVTSGFEGLGGFFAALDKETGNEISEMARLEAIQNLAVKEPSEDKEANRQAYIEELNSVLDQTGFHLWQEYQKQIFAEKHPELLSGFDFQAAMQIENQLNDPKPHIKALSEEEIKNADNRIGRGEPLSLAEMAGICKGRDLLNKPARAELMAVIKRAAAAEKIEGSDLVALQYLLDEVERVPEYKKLAEEETLTAARRHGSGFRGNLNVYRQFQQTLERQTVEFERNSFSNKKVLKSSLAAVMCARSAAMARKAERLSFKTKAKAVWGKIRDWDDKMTKKHSFLYPLAKTAAIGATTGVAGLMTYSGFKLYKQIRGNYQKYKEEAAKAKAEGREFYKNYRSYFCAKENRKEAYQIGGAALLSGISAYFGGAAVVEHGISAVTGLSGQIAQHGLSGLSNGGAALSGLWHKVANMDWNTVGEMAKSVATNTRVLASTGTSVFTGIMTSRETAKEQRAAEERLDALLKEYGVSELPTDKKLLKLRSSDPAAYFAEVLKQNNITLNQEKTTQLNSVAKEVDAKRREKNMRRWGAIGGSAAGLVMAGLFGAKPEDLQQPAADAAGADTSDTGIAAESKDVAGAGVPENADTAADNTAPAAAAEIDLNNLSNEQKHDLDMLFKRYPRAASLILEGNDNPAVTDSPTNGVVTSAKLQAMYEGGDISPEKLKDMVKFAGEHFDAKGNFVGPDAEALNAEAEGYQQSRVRAGSGRETVPENGSSELSDNENRTEQPADNTVQDDAAKDGEEGTVKEVPEEKDEHTDGDEARSADGDKVLNEDAETVVPPTEHELTGKGVKLTYRIEESDNEHGYNLVRDGDVKVDKTMLKQMYKDIEYKDGEYVAANGHIHHQDMDIVRERVKLLCTEVTKENYIAEDISARGNPTEAEQAFLRSHENHLTEYGVKAQSDDMYAKVESRAVEPVSDNPVKEPVAENKTPDNPAPAAEPDNKDTVVPDDNQDKKVDDAPVQAAEPVPHEIHQKGINVSYSIEDGQNSSGFRLRYDGSVSVDRQMLNEMREGITKQGDMYVAANGAIRSSSLNIVNSKITMLCQQATVQNAIADQLLTSGTELSSAEQAFLKSHAAQMSKYGIEYTPPQGAAQIETNVTNACATGNGFRLENVENVSSGAMLTRGENGMMTTQSGYSFAIDAKGNIIHQSVLSEAAQVKAEAEIYAALSSSKNLQPNEQAFVSDYAQTHHIDTEVRADAALLAENTEQPATRGAGATRGVDEEQPAVIKKTGSGRPVSRDPYEDDIYYRPEKRGGNGVAAASKDVATPVGDDRLEDSQEADTSAHTSHEPTVVSRHRIWEYRGIKGHYSFVDTGANAPVVDISHLNNIPEQLDLRAHLRATHEWNGNATYEEYLGGAIRGTPNEVNAQFHAFCKNLEGSDVVYRDMQHQIAEGYRPSVAEQKWMRGFERDLKTIGLDYVDGKLTPVQSPQSLKAQWYGTSDNIKTSQILQCRAQHYNR